MPRFPLLTTIFCVVTAFAFSRDLTVKCGSKTVDCENGNKHQFEIVVLRPYEEIDTALLPLTVRIRAQEYLEDRTGPEFYAKLHYYSSQIIDFNRLNEIRKTKKWVDNSGDRRIKYAIQYYFYVQDSMRYYLSLVFDKDGNIISADQLPYVKQNAQFGKIISICDAEVVAEHDSKLPGPSTTVSLEYLQAINSFVWRIEKPSVRGKKSNERIRRYTLVNANTCVIVKREVESWFTACSGVQFW